MNNCIFDELDVEKSTNKQHVDYIYKILKNHESRLQGIERKTESCLGSLYDIVENLDTSVNDLHLTAERFSQMKNSITRIIDIIKYMQNPQISQLDSDKYETET